MKKIFFLYVLLGCMAVFGQEVITAEDLQEDRFIISDNDRIRISEFLFDITGQTQPYAITKNLDLTEQPEYYTPSEFEFYIKDLNQQLKNLRVMVDTDITVEYERTETGFIDARVTIHGRDTWNILVLPGPKYNSNTGVSLKLKYKDENFLGSLEPFYVDFVFAQNKDLEEGISRPGIDVATSVTYPFFWKNLNWDLDLSLDANLPFRKSETYEFNVTTGLGTSIPIKDILSFDFGTKFGMHRFDRDDDNNIYVGDEMYWNNQFYLNVPITIYDFDYWGELEYTPNVSININWDMDKIVNEDLKGPSLSFGHSVSFGRVDWLGNNRQGVSTSLNNSFGYNFNTKKLTMNLSTSLKGYYAPLEWLGITAKAGWFYNFYKYDNTSFTGDVDSAGGDIRGILDYRIKTESALYFGFDLPVTVLHFDAEKIFNGNKILSIFGFDLQLSPFFDFMLTHDPKTDRWYDFRDGWYGGGLQIIAHPHKWRSYQVRACVGFDLSEVFAQKRLYGVPAKRDGQRIYEMSLGFGLEY